MTGQQLEGREEGAASVRVAGLVALGAFLLLLISGRSLDLLGSPARIGLVLAWAAVAIAFWLSERVSIVVAYVVLGGLLMRWIDLPAGGVGPSELSTLFCLPARGHPERSGALRFAQDDNAVEVTPLPSDP